MVLVTKKQQKTMVVDEVTRLEQEQFHVKVTIEEGRPTTPSSEILPSGLERRLAARLCGNTKASLQHILSGRKVGLTQGRFRC